MWRCKIAATFYVISYLYPLLDKQNDTVLDTNIIFAGLYSVLGAYYQILKALSAGYFQPVLSVTLLFEYEDVLKHNSRKLGCSFQEIDAFLGNICDLSSFHKIHYLWRPFLPDPKDDHILELAVAAKASHIVTFNTKDSVVI